ncbi:MAG TPA: hypothetical protein VM582_01115, partial [Candidatus Thermoplasmatota archaeon]|nr:hypothetical protein [Candidatus Thermoplasmatota archaeon]
MVDAPRWAPRLAERVEAMGGVAHILLTHRDDAHRLDALREARRPARRVDHQVPLRPRHEPRRRAEAVPRVVAA